MTTRNETITENLINQITISKIEQVIISSCSQRNVLVNLGLTPMPKTYTWLNKVCSENNIQLMDRNARVNQKSHISDENFKESLTRGSISGALIFLGLKPYSGNYIWFKKKCVDLGMSVPEVQKIRSFKRPDDVVFVRNSEFAVTGKQLKNRLVKRYGWKDRCMNPSCPNPEPTWDGRPLTIQVDHINGDHTDNRIENLRFLCPNCHSQTDTFCGKKNPNLNYSKVRSKCLECHGPKATKSKLCHKCYQKSDLYQHNINKFKNSQRQPKIVWPDKTILLEMFESNNIEQISKKLGVSSNAIRKHLKTKYSLTYNRKGLIVNYL